MEQIFNARKLFMARQSKKISRQDVANIIGVTKGTIQSYEDGRAQPKLGRIKEIADAVGLTIEDLISDTMITSQGEINNVIVQNFYCNKKFEELENELINRDDFDFQTVREILKMIKKIKNKE